jgi:RNA 3'-terminal phosphate cyclase-like protein
MVDSARAVLNDFIPDVWIYTELVKNGPSLYYGLCLHSNTYQGSSMAYDSDPNQANLDLESTPRPDPEGLGRIAALRLLDEIHCSSSRISSTHVPFVLTLMALSDSSQISKLVIGRLSSYAVNQLRIVKLFFGTQFKFEELESRFSISKREELEEMEDRKQKSQLVVASCIGCGLINRNKQFD